MGIAAGFCRKPKPELMRRTSRFVSTLETSQRPSPVRTATTRACQMTARSLRLESQNLGRSGTLVVLMLRAAIFSVEGRRIHQPAFGGERVLPARHLHERLLAKMPVEDFAIIADGFDHLDEPILGDTQSLAEVVLRAEHALDRNVLGTAGELADIRLGDTALFGFDEAVVHPAHEGEPFPIAARDIKRI